MKLKECYSTTRKQQILSIHAQRKHAEGNDYFSFISIKKKITKALLQEEVKEEYADKNVGEKKVF